MLIMRTFRLALCLLLCAAASLVAQQPAPGEQPTFRADVALVEVATVVVDKAGNPIGDLTADDFEILENGAPRPLASLRRLVVRNRGENRLATSIGDARVETLATNVGIADAPAFVLVLDDLNTSPFDAHRVIRAGLGVLEALPREALVAVVTTSGLGGSLFTLSAPGGEHAERVKAFRGRLLLTGARAPEFARRMVVGQPQLGSSVDAPCGQVAFDENQSQDCGDPTRAARRAQVIESVGQLLGRAGSRRKVVFWVTEDMGVSPLDPQGNQDAQRAALQRVLNADVAVYPVNPREGHADVRTQADLQEGDRGDNRPDRRTGGLVRFGPGDGALGTQGGQTLEFNTDDMVAVTLDQMARESGGRWITNANDLETVLAAVVRQNATSYLLAFESAYATTPGRHRIEVRVRRDNAQVFARRGYIVADTVEAASATTSSNTNSGTLLREMVGGTVAQGQLPMHVQVIPEFATGREGRALVTIQLDATAADASAVEVLVVAVDNDGNMGVPQAFRLTPSDTDDGDGWTFTTPIALARGAHQVRVAAATTDGTRSGLVLVPVEIVEPGNRLVMAPAVLLGNTTDAQVAPTLTRTFDVGMPIGVQAEVAGRPVRDQRVTMAASLRDGRGEVVREADAVLDSGPRPDRARATAVLSTTGVIPGEYMLVTEALAVERAEVVRHAIPVTLREASPDRVGADLTTGAGSASPPPDGTGTSLDADGSRTARSAVPTGVTTLPVAHGPTSLFDRGGTHVIRTADAWQLFWKHLPTRQAAPDIDFDRVTVLAVVLGDEPGQVPEVTGSRADGADLVVEWRATAADEPVASSRAARPFVVVGITDYDGPVRFERVE
jgi:VWFA-related protein